MSGEPDDLVRRVGTLFEAIGPVTFTSNLLGARWSKLALNCAISSLGTIAGERLGPLSRVRRVRRLALEIMTEVVAVARKEQVRLEKVAGTIDLEWIALTDAERKKVGSPGLTAKASATAACAARCSRRSSAAAPRRSTSSTARSSTAPASTACRRRSTNGWSTSSTPSPAARSARAAPCSRSCTTRPDLPAERSDAVLGSADRSTSLWPEGSQAS
jgi:hypothetical protein